MISPGLAEANKKMLDEMSDQEYEDFLKKHPEYIKYIKDMNYRRKE